MGFGLLLFIFGLIIGSFINVVAFRYSGSGSLFSFRKISGRSKCPYCGRKLKWYELIPLASFLRQAGNCLGCGRKLSWQYPLVELAGGFALLTPAYLAGSEGVVWTFAFLAMILMSAIDWRLQIIPDQINLFLAGLGAVLGFLGTGSFLLNYAGLFILTGNLFADRVIAAAAAMLFFGFIIMASRGKAMGVGDLKLAGALGLLLGWPDIILSLSFSFIIGAAAGLAFLAANKKKLKSTIPFGPFLAGGAAIHVFWGYEIVKWYFSL